MAKMYNSRNDHNNPGNKINIKEVEEVEIIIKEMDNEAGAEANIIITREMIIKNQKGRNQLG